MFFKKIICIFAFKLTLKHYNMAARGVVVGKGTEARLFDRSETLKAYVSEMRMYTTPTPQEEEELFLHIENGDESAKNELILRHQRFVLALAKNFAQTESDIMELVSEINIAMLESVDSFQLNRGFRFLSYAVWYARKGVSEYFSHKKGIMSKQYSTHNFAKIREFESKFANKNGYFPSPNEIREGLQDIYGVSLRYDDDVNGIQVYSLSQESDYDDNDQIMENSKYFTDKTASYNDYENIVNSEYNKDIIHRYLQKVSEKSRKILCMLYGIGYERCYDSGEIAEIMGMTKTNVQTVRRKALAKMRKAYSAYKNKANQTNK